MSLTFAVIGADVTTFERAAFEDEIRHGILRRILVRDSRLVRHQHGGSTEHVGKGIVDEVEARKRVEVGVAQDLRTEEGEAGARAEEGAEFAVRRIHFMRHFLKREKN